MPASPHPADAHDLIRVRGARENNLRGISLDIPKRRLTVFTGVSGSGKSSLVFGTVAAESQRMINETYSSFVQGFMPQLARPDVDSLEGLTTAIIVDQERMGANVRSTVGTVTDANAHLRTLFSKLAEPHVGGPGAYSFNVPSVSASGAMTVQKGAKTIAEKTTFSRVGGMCPRCEGMGKVTDLDLTELYDEDKSLEDGPFLVPGYSAGGWYEKLFASSGFFPADKPIRSFTKRQLHDFLYKEPTKVKLEGANMTYEGLIPKIQKSMLSKDRDSMSASHPRLRGSSGHLHPLPGVRGHAPGRACPHLAYRRALDRRCLRDADLRARRLGPAAAGAEHLRTGRSAAGEPLGAAGRLHRDRAGLPVPGSSLGHPLRR